ncbi:MAG: glycosyltransferase [Egibacteraceae bacterium]
MSTPDGPILFVSPAPAGLFNPLFAIARELSHRGVTGVCFACTEDRRADVESLSGSTPVQFVSLGTSAISSPADWDEATYAAMARQSKAKSAAAFLSHLADFEDFEAMYRRMLAEVERLQPSLMVIDFITAYALDAAMTREIPFTLSVPHLPSHLFNMRLPRDYPTPCSGLPRHMTAAQRCANILFKFRLLGALLGEKPLRAFVRKRRALGLGNPLFLSAPYCDAAVAIFSYTVFGLEYPFPAAPPKLEMLGAIVPPLPEAEDGDNELSRWLSRHDSIVYIGFGTIMRLDRTQIASILAAIARLGPSHQVLWKLPKSQQVLLPRSELPANLRIEHWLPSQLNVLAHPHVRVFFNHGGGNGVNEGLYFGKPLLVLPFWLDCYDIAVRVTDSGAGLSLQDTQGIDPDEVVTKLSRLLTDAGFRERAMYWGQRLREAGGVSAAADIVVERHRQPRILESSNPRASRAIAARAGKI